MEFKDYYKIMGVEPKASADEIKRAYRKLARKYHPDVSKESDAEARFKEVGEAYAVLQDPQKRAAYDQLRQGGWRGGEEFTPPPGWEFRGGAQGGEGFARGGRAGFTRVNPEEFSDFFETLFGGGGLGGFGGFERGGFESRGRRTFRARGEDLVYPLPISLEEAYAGGIRTLQLRTPDGKTRTLNVKIPPGVTHGQQIRLQGQGGSGQGGGPNGDLYLDIQIQSHPLFHVDGRDIILNLPITPWEAALGTTVQVPTPSGKIALKIPPGSQTGTKLRLKGRGLPGNPPGDLYVLLQVVVPKADTDAAKKLYQEMARVMPFNPRERL